MNPSCAQTNLVLDGLFALLACGKCKQTPERPVRFVTCGHFFCDSCVENDTICRQCRSPVKDNEKRPYNTIAQLINYCTTIKEMISNLDVGDVWTLANEIHQLTTDHREKIEESVTHSNQVRESTVSDKNESISESVESSIKSVENLRCKKKESEKASIVNSSRISKNQENVSFVDSQKINDRCEKNNLHSENLNSVDSLQSSKCSIKNDLHPKNPNFVNSTQISHKCEENYLHPGNVSFVHSTQIIERQRGENGQAETPGYIDPTQISPIHRQDSDSETPGYRDPTQVIHQLNDSNYDPETPGYRDPTQISRERDDENSADETIGYVEPTQITPRVKKSNRKIHNVLETEAASVANWQNNMQMVVDDKNLFSPIAESKCDETLVPETPDMDESMSESTIIPESLDVDMYDDLATITNTRDSDRETEKLTEGKLARQTEKMKTLQRKTYPMSDYDAVGIKNFRDSVIHSVDSVGKTPLRFNRRLTDPTLDRRNHCPTAKFDTRSVPDVRDSFMDDENEKLSMEAIKQKNNLALEKRQTRISLNDRWTPKIDNVRIEFSNTLSVKDTRPKQLRRIKDLKLDRQNKISINPRGTLDIEKHGDFPIETEDLFETEKILNIENKNPILKNRYRMVDDETTSVFNAQNAPMGNIEKAQSSRLRNAKNGLLTRSIETALNDHNALGINNVRNSVTEAADVQKQRPIKYLRRLSDWEVDRQRRTSNNCETMESPFTYNDEEAKKESAAKPLRHWRSSILDRQNKTSTDTRETRDLAKMDSIERVNQMKRIKNRALHRLNEDSFSDRDTIGLVDGADLLETAVYETEFNDEDSPMKRQSNLPKTKKSIANAQDTAMENKESDEEKSLPRHLQRLTDWPLNEQKQDSINDSDTVDVTKIGDSILEFEKLPEARPMRQLRRLNKKPANHTIIRNDLRDLDITNIQDFDKEKQPNKYLMNESDTVDVSNVGDSLDKPKIISDIRPLRQLRRLQKSKPDYRDIIATDLHGVDITNIHDFSKVNQQNECPMDESDTVDVSNVNDLLEEPKKLTEVKPLRQLRRLQMSKQDHRSIIASDLHGVDITNINDFGNEKQANECPMDESDTVDVSKVDDLLEEPKKLTEVKPLRQLRRLQMPKQDHRSIIASDLHGVDITNINDFGNEKQENERPMTESDTVEASNVRLDDEPRKIPEVKPLRQLRRLQKLKPDHRSVIASDLQSLDITNIQDFDNEKEPNECPMDESDTVDVAIVGDLREESIPEVRSLKHLKHLDKAKPDDRSIIASDLHGVDITNIQDFRDENHSNECPMDESDTVDVSNVADLLDEPQEISKVRPLRQLGHLQKSKPNDSRSVVAKNQQDFDQEKQPDECAINESDTVDVSNVGDLLDEPQKIPEIRPLRQVRRLQKLKLNHENIMASDVHGLDTTNSEIFVESQALLVEKPLKTYANLNKKRPSTSPPNDYHTAGTSDTETAIETPLKQLRSVENLNIDTQNKIPAKRAKAKIVQLKPRRRTNDKVAAAPKVIPKNVNKRNVKGETVLHNACVKGQADYVRSLLEAGANPNTKDNANWTPLQEVVKLGKREICEMLLQFGASPNTPGIENRTALHDASQNDKLEEATLLLRFNANRDVYDKYGKRPIDYAISDEMRALLADDHAVEKMIGEAPGVNATLDQSIITPNTKVVVLPANLNSANKKILSKIASKLKVTVATSFRPGVTHIVVEANERNITELTHQVILAILQGIWILNSQWIAISMDLHDFSEIDLELFEVRGAPNPGTPECSRMNEEKQNPRLFNNCFFYFTIGARGNWKYGNLEFTKTSLTKLVLAGQGEILRREPDPEDVKDNEITPFHVADKPTHSLHRCSHYIIYMPGKDEPRIKYNMPHIKTLPLAWLIECIEKFALVDPVLIGIL